MRRRNIKNATEKLNKYDEIMIFNAQDYKGQMNNLFEKKQPIHLEIGMGKGKFIIGLAKKNPEINYIGFEKYDSVILQAVTKAEDLHLSNLKMMSADATNLLDYFEENEIDKIYLNFSDPWPKARHAKRRLTSPNFLKLYEVVTKKPTEIEFKTDNRKLFEYSLQTFNEAGYRFVELSLDLHQDATLENKEIVTTEYEDKFSSMGNPIYYVKVTK